MRFDCHAHVYDHVVSLGPARYLPERSAPLATWLALQRAHDLLGGVIVQVSFLGTDNTQLLDALSMLDRRRFAGVAVVPLDVDEETLAELVGGGVRGLRWNLVGGAELPDPRGPVERAFLQRIAGCGLHLEVQLESARLAGLLPSLLGEAETLVVDHLGLPIADDPRDEPWLNTLAALGDRSGLYVKLSAPYRSAVDPHPHLRRLVDLLNCDRFVWGSDWPHTRHERVGRYDALLHEMNALGAGDVAANRLYGLATCDTEAGSDLSVGTLPSPD